MVGNVDITHSRLVELTKLADMAEPFYDWVEKIFRQTFHKTLSLNEILSVSTLPEIATGIRSCYFPYQEELPLLFDGIGRPYEHKKACFFFFSWLVRDAPQQRLTPLLSRAVRAADKGISRQDIEIQALASLIVEYRENIKSFEWFAVREVIADRLEGSRRSIKGHQKEVIVRTGVVAAIQNYYGENESYGVFNNVQVAPKEVKIGRETFDVVIDLIRDNGGVTRILVPVKTRETQGGGHAHLFTRDIKSAIGTAKRAGDYFVIAVIVAQNWDTKEQGEVTSISDLALISDESPNAFEAFSAEAEAQLNEFFRGVLSGEVVPRKYEEIASTVEE
jgi:hypothetical protein